MIAKNEDGEEEVDEKKVMNIVIAPRALSKGECSQVYSSFEIAGRPREEMTDSLKPLFERNKDVNAIEQRQSTSLKKLFTIPNEFLGKPVNERR